MPGSITLPQVVLDLEEEDRKRYEALKPPSSIVVRYGYMRYVAELPYDGTAKPGCGSKLVVRTRRGTEIGEMLTTTCGNGGCGKNVTRKQMLDYIDASGGRDYPFSREGKVLRVATLEDLNQQSALESKKMAAIRSARKVAADLNLQMKVVEAEFLLGGDRIIFHYTAENWIDFREMVRLLAQEFSTRIEMHQVSARDEARLVADYEKCGQHCCCKQFLKVLKPVSMRSAKVQKATLDPTKISGRCGRLMCCLRYEDETYESLRKKLPKKNQRVKSEEGEGYVLDTQILTQLVLIRLDKQDAPQAFPLEHLEILTGQFHQPQQRPREDGPGGSSGGPQGRGPRRDGPPGRPGNPGASGGRDQRDHREPRRPQPGAPLRDDEVESREGASAAEIDEAVDASSDTISDGASPPSPPPSKPVSQGYRRLHPNNPPRPDANAARGAGDGRGAAGPNEPPSNDAGDANLSDTDDASDGGESDGDSAGLGDAPAAGGDGASGPVDPNNPQQPRRRRRRRRGRGGRGRGPNPGGPEQGGGGGGSGGGPQVPPSA